MDNKENVFEEEIIEKLNKIEDSILKAEEKVKAKRLVREGKND